LLEIVQKEGDSDEARRGTERTSLHMAVRWQKYCDKLEGTLGRIETQEGTSRRKIAMHKKIPRKIGDPD